jgi:hypothetical protein
MMIHPGQQEHRQRVIARLGPDQQLPASTEAVRLGLQTAPDRPRRGPSPAHGPSSGCCAPRRVLPTHRGAPAGGQGSVALGAPGCGPRGVGTRACGRRPSAEHPGDHVRAEGAAGDGHRAARGPRWARSSARASATRPEMPQVSGEGSKMSQHSRPQVRALRASRVYTDPGLVVYRPLV